MRERRCTSYKREDEKDITFDDLKEYIFLNPLSPLHYLGFCHYYFVSISLML